MTNEKLILETLRFILIHQIRALPDDTIPYAEGLVIYEKLGEVLNPTKSEVPYKENLPKQKVVLAIYKTDNHVKDNIAHYLDPINSTRYSLEEIPNGYKIVYSGENN